MTSVNTEENASPNGILEVVWGIPHNFGVGDGIVFYPHPDTLIMDGDGGSIRADSLPNYAEHMRDHPCCEKHFPRTSASDDSASMGASDE